MGQRDADKSQELLVINRGQQPLAVTVQKRNFVARPDGTLDYQADAPYAASAWLTVSPARFRLAPGATQVVTADIATPEHPDAGEHQAAIVFMVPAGTGAGNVKINRGLATPMYISVPGSSDDSVVLDRLRGPAFADGGPVNLDLDLHSAGTVHRDFRGATALHVTSAGSSTAFPDFTVLRGAARTAGAPWDPPLLCVCHPRVSLTNADGTVQSATMQVIVFPWHLSAIAAGLLLVVILLPLWYRRRGRTGVAADRAAARLRGERTDEPDQQNSGADG